MPEDRPFRLTARTRAALRVNISSGDTPSRKGEWAVIRDISHRGAFLCCDLPLTPGDRLRLRLEGEPGEETLELEAEVRWTTQGAGAQASAEAGAQASAEAGAQASAEAGAQAGAEAGAQAGAESGVQAGAEAGAQAGAGIAFLEPTGAMRRRIHELEAKGEIPVLELYEEEEP